MFFQSKRQQAVISIFIIVLTFSVESAAASENFSQLLAKAHSGSASAQFDVAEAYYHGDGVARNYQNALSWYEKSASQNHAEAQHQMGYFYKHGLANLAKDDKKAFEWYLKAAEQGHTASQTQVAIMYSQGTGVKQNKELSRQWSNRVLKKKGLL